MITDQACSTEAKHPGSESQARGCEFPVQTPSEMEVRSVLEGPGTGNFAPTRALGNQSVV